MNMKKILLTISLCLLTASAAAAGFGVSGDQTQAANSQDSQQNAIAQLLAASKSSSNSNANSANQSATSSSAATSAKALSPSEAAFANLVRNMMPLTPTQIKTLHYLFNKSQKAASTYPGIPPKPTSTSVIVNLAPNSTPPVIRLRAGYVTSLDFVDSTGQPWPIVAYDIGDPKAFNVAPNQPNGKSNTILVQALDTYKAGNLAVKLKGKSTWIMLTLMPGQRAVDYRVDLHVPGLGPDAKPVVNGLPNTANPKLLTFLNGVPPQGATAVDVTGGPAQAWIYKGELYLRTQMTVLSPAWKATMSSADGTHVYEMQKAPIVLASERGAMVKLNIKLPS